MASDLLGGLGGLGGLFKGLSGLMPQDDPNVKLINAQSQVADLTAQETAVYTEIGRVAYERDRSAFPAQADRLRLIQANLAQAQAALSGQTEAKKAAEEQARAASEAAICPNCGHQNAEGVKFCQECGAKLGGPAACPSCGQANPPGTRFCGGCGHALAG